MALKLTKRHSSPFWYVRGTIQGRSIDRSTRTHDKAQAERIKSKIEHELFESGVSGKPSPMSYPAATVAYLRTKPPQSARFHDRLIEHFGQYFVHEIKQADVDEAAETLYRGKTPGTINRQVIGPISAVLKFAAKREWCPARAIERRREPKSNPHILTDKERHRFMEVCNPAFKNLMTFMWLTGARTSEALWLDWRDVDLSVPEVRFTNTKNDEPRTVPLHDAAVAMLANLPHRENEVFRKPNGLPYSRPLPDQDEDTSGGSRIATAFKGACSRAKIKDFTPHDVRHNWATEHYRANKDLLMLQRHGGWKSLRMVERYAHLSNAHGHDEINRLNWGKSGEQETPQPNNTRKTNT